MSTDQLNTYEGMFLFSHTISGNLQGAVDHLKDLLNRAQAEVISLRKWEERRLAYEIRGTKRGIYFLVYFRALPTAMAGLERDCNLSEQLLRSLIIRADHIEPEIMAAADGQAALADEIKLRAQETAASSS